MVGSVRPRAVDVGAMWTAPGELKRQGFAPWTATKKHKNTQFPESGTIRLPRGARCQSSHCLWRAKVLGVQSQRLSDGIIAKTVDLPCLLAKDG